MQRLAGGPELPKQMAEMDRELRALQQQVGFPFQGSFSAQQTQTLALGFVHLALTG